MPVDCSTSAIWSSRPSLLELAGREVHADLQPEPEGVEPRLRTQAGLLEDRPADGEDGAVVLGQLDEMGRGQDPVLGMVPPHQGLRPDDPLVRQRNERLEVDLDLLALDRMIEGRVEVEAAGRASAHPVHVEQRDLALAAALLGPVHRHVSVVQKIVARGAGVAQRDADAHRRDHLVAATEHDRFAQGVQHPVGHLAGVLGRGHPFQDDHEFVPTETGQRVARPDGTPEALSDDPQHLVAHPVAQVVVDDLEPIDVTEENGDATSRTISLEQGVVEVIEEQAAVGQPGQRVLERMARQLLLEGLAL